MPESQLDLLDWYPRGETADIPRDGKRLGDQLQKVYTFMRSTDWTTLQAISAAVGAPEASVSARLRDLRHLGYQIELVYVTKGLHKYKLSRSA